MENNTSNIKSFSVYGLFGTDDVHIPFDENIKILVGENGIGKTQVLNLFYYTLTRDFFRLGEFNFDRLVLRLNNGDDIKISKDHIDELIKQIYDHPQIKTLVAEFGYSQIESLRKKYIQSRSDNKNLEEEYRYLLSFTSSSRRYPLRSILRVFDQIEINKEDDSTLLNNCEKAIEFAIAPTEIMYFPTYRRVEEDLHNLGYNDGENLNQEDKLIQFGMDDVKNRFDQIETKIDQLLKEGFSKISSEILSQLVRGFSSTKENFENILNKIDENDIEIILARVGYELNEQDKDKIRKSFKNKKFENPSLIYMLQKLVEIYEKQKELDNSVKKFRDICNQYLINKKVFYDESEIKLFIKSEKTDSEIELSQLSSGEKQIISIFSKIYLSESDKRFIVLFDEPELSLSMIWQKKLLPDIVNSGKCDLLLAVTHSPFIFDNELDKYAIGLDQYIQPSEIIKV
jgi:predicted ATPase